jgi:hypothetical protein
METVLAGRKINEAGLSQLVIALGHNGLKVPKQAFRI